MEYFISALPLWLRESFCSKIYIEEKALREQNYVATVYILQTMFVLKFYSSNKIHLKEKKIDKDEYTGQYKKQLGVKQISTITE